MLHRDEARDLIAYDAWANERMAQILERAASVDAKIRRTWAHLAAASALWHARCAGEDYKQIAVWPAETDVRESSLRLRAVLARWAEVARDWTDDDAQRIVRFTNSRGEPCADQLGDIVRHLVNHGTHHRGQIAMRLRESGTEPADFDYIIYCREKTARKP